MQAPKRKFLPFAMPDISDEEINAVVQTMKSGWITTGVVTKQFESLFKYYIASNAEYLPQHESLNNPQIIKLSESYEAISVNSATAGLHLALEACGINAGDEVLVPTLTFTATAEVVRYLGANPIFIDSDPETLNLDLTQIEAKITPNTKAIIPVHFAGLACDMPKIIAIAKKFNLKVIEDAAHALPSIIDGKLIGTHDSDAIVYSFYATKTITTGEGGMIITKNPEIAKRCRIMRLHGISRDAFDRYTSTVPSWYYEIVAPGYKYNMSDIASSIGIEQLKKVNKFWSMRQKMANVYIEELKNAPIKIFNANYASNDNSLDQNYLINRHSWHLFVINLLPDANIDQNTFIKNLADNQIGTSVHFIPLHIQPYWRDTYKLKSSNYPIATKYYQNAISLPLYTKMTELDQEYVIDNIKKMFK